MDRNRQQERGVARLAGCCDKWKQTHRKALRHKSQSMCPVLCSSSPCYYEGPSRDACATSPWRPTRRDSLDVSGHKWYTYHIFLFFVWCSLCFCIWFTSFVSLGAHSSSHARLIRPTQYATIHTLLFIHCRLSVLCLWAINEAHRIGLFANYVNCPLRPKVGNALNEKYGKL